MAKKYSRKSSRRRSVMKHNFSRVPSVQIPRSVFRRDHGYKTTFDAGYLVPFYVDEALPGDTFSLNATMFARLATPIVPLMDNMVMETFFFAVPNRLVWDNFQRFMGEQKNPSDSTDYLVPELSFAGSAENKVFGIGSIGDFFGLPTQTTMDGQSISALHFRAYNLIWNEWFRDQNLQDSLIVPTGDGPDGKSIYKLQRRGKRHDYFTSALPWPQKGPGVELPLGGNAPVTLTGSSFDEIDTPIWRTAADGSNAAEGLGVGGNSELKMFGSNAAEDIQGVTHLSGFGTGKDRLYYDPKQTLEADLSQVTAATINSLRQAFQMQRMLERDARGGTRYTEIVQSHFRVVSPDARLQRPEYLGGGSVPINVMPVPQTGSTDETTPQGNLAAYGVTGSSRNGFSKSFTEHTLIIGLVNVRADLTYQQGIPRMFSRRTKYDFYWPAMAHLGEQAILNKEIFYRGAQSAEAENVFGYQERWAEYRYFPSKITGKFRSDYEQSLDYWHLSQHFDTTPTLSSAFIEDRPPIDRVIAVPDEPHFLLDAFINLRTARPMPTYSVPGMIDHF